MLEEIVKNFPMQNLIDTDKLNELFNKDNILSMFVNIKMYENISKFLEEIQVNKMSLLEMIKHHNVRLVEETSMPAYHIDPSCERMKSNFFNISLPVSFIKSDKNELAREWIKNHKLYSKFRTSEVDFMQLNKEFKSTFECSEDLQIIQKDNSGTSMIDNRRVDEFLENPYVDIERDFLKQYTQLRFFLDGEFADKIKKLAYMPDYKLEDTLQTIQNPEEKYAIHEFHTVKHQLQQVIMNAYRVKYGFDYSVDQKILNSLGFKKCSCTLAELNAA